MRYTHLMGAAALAMLSPTLMFADNGSDAGAGGAPAPEANAAQPAAPKRYLASATHRTLDDAKRKAGEPKTVTFIVEGPGYKEAWQTAREVTRMGTANLEEGVTVTSEDGKPLEMLPGRYTVGELKSMQDRGKKAQPITLDNLLEVAAAKDVKIPKQVADLIEELRKNPAGATGGTQQAATNA